MSMGTWVNMPYTPGWEIVRTPYRPLQVEPQLYLRINLSDTSRFTVKSSTCHYMHGWRTIFGPPVPIFQILSSTWRRLQVDGQFSDPLWCCCSQPGRPMQVDGQLWLCDTNLKTYAGWRTIFGPAVTVWLSFTSTWRPMQVNGQFSDLTQNCQNLWRRRQVDGHTDLVFYQFYSTWRRLQVDGQLLERMYNTNFYWRLNTQEHMD